MRSFLSQEKLASGLDTLLFYVEDDLKLNIKKKYKEPKASTVV